MSEPPWLQAPLRRVRALEERLPHALLIQGPPGWGEGRVANAIAIDLLGLRPNQAASEVAHPDLRWLEPEDGVIKIDAIRRIIDFLMQTPKLAGRKVAVIEDADRMNLNAANALLKTLEEPPAESFLALTTGAAERLLPTIKSRCQRIDVPPAPPAEVTTWLVAGGADAEAAGHLAVEYGGAPYAVLAALARDQAPLWPLLAQAGKTPAKARELADERRTENLADIVGRWLRIVHWLARRSPAHELAPLLDFAFELSKVREAALFNSGLNRPLQLQRLLLMWGELWPQVAASQARRSR